MFKTLEWRPKTMICQFQTQNWMFKPSSLTLARCKSSLLIDWSGITLPEEGRKAILLQGHRVSKLLEFRSQSCKRYRINLTMTLDFPNSRVKGLLAKNLFPKTFKPSSKWKQLGLLTQRIAQVICQTTSNMLNQSTAKFTRLKLVYIFPLVRNKSKCLESWQFATRMVLLF
jgi:hypothetical protein